METSLILEFLSKIDEFLQLQIETAVSGGDRGLLASGHAKCLNDLTSIDFESPELQALKEKWINSVSGASVTVLGFPEFRRIRPSDPDFESRLDRERRRTPVERFSNWLGEFPVAVFNPLGTDLECSYDDWLIRKNVPFPQEIDPEEFLRKTFQIVEYDPGNHAYRFFRSKKGDFFMGSLLAADTHLIGHGPVDSLFRLSMLAHEIGHSTRPRPPSVEGRYRAIEEWEADAPLANEYDSYAYEKLFMTFSDKLLDGDFTSDQMREMHETLVRRKAIQFNRHLLGHRLNQLFFSGESFDRIEDFFAASMKALYRGFEPKRRGEWITLASLDRPLFKLPYVRAYIRVFS